MGKCLGICMCVCVCFENRVFIYLVPPPKLIMTERKKNSNLIVIYSGEIWQVHLNHVIKVNINRNGTNRYHVPPDIIH